VSMMTGQTDEMDGRQKVTLCFPLDPTSITRVLTSGTICYREQKSSLLWTSALRPYSNPVHLPRERKGIARCVLCVCATCGKGGRSEKLVGYFYSTPLLDMFYCLA